MSARPPNSLHVMSSRATLVNIFIISALRRHFHISCRRRNKSVNIFLLCTSKCCTHTHTHPYMQCCCNFRSGFNFFAVVKLSSPCLCFFLCFFFFYSHVCEKKNCPCGVRGVVFQVCVLKKAA